MNTTSLEPYQNLWAAVLERALLDLRDDDGDPRIRHAALDWMLEDRNGVGSFGWVCMVLEVEKDWLKVAIVKALENCRKQNLKWSTVISYLMRVITGKVKSEEDEDVYSINWWGQ